MAIRLHPLHHLPVISNGSSGAPEKNWNDVWGYDLVTFWKLPNLTDRDLPHLDLPTSEKLANQGRINPRHCKCLIWRTTPPRHSYFFGAPDETFEMTARPDRLYKLVISNLSKPA